MASTPGDAFEGEASADGWGNRGGKPQSRRPEQASGGSAASEGTHLRPQRRAFYVSPAEMAQVADDQLPLGAGLDSAETRSGEQVVGGWSRRSALAATQDNWQRALALWLRWNEAYENLTSGMIQHVDDCRAAEDLMDQMDQVRAEAIKLSRKLVGRQPVS